MKLWKEFWKEEDGVETVEILLIVAALVCIALIFREAIVGFVQNAIATIFGSDTTDATSVTAPTSSATP